MLSIRFFFTLFACPRLENYALCLLKDSEAVPKPRERQYSHETCEGHEAEGLSLRLRQRTVACCTFEFCVLVSMYFPATML